METPGPWINSAKLVKELNIVYKAISEEVKNGECNPNIDDWECRVAEYMAEVVKIYKKHANLNLNTSDI